MPAQEDIIFHNPSYFHPRLTTEDIDRLDPLFCVDSLKNSRVFSFMMRDIKIISYYHERFGLKEGYTTKDIHNSLLGYKLAVVRRPSVNGIKQDNKLIVEEGVYIGMEGAMLGYNMTNIIVKINDMEEHIKPGRVFLIK